MTSSDFDMAPRPQIPLALALITLLAAINIASAAVMLLGQG